MISAMRMARNVINSHLPVKRKVKKSLRIVGGLVFAGFAAAASAGGIDDIKRHCDGSPDPDFCNDALATIDADYAGANRGDYASQRNLAFCLETGCSGATVIDPDTGCAWRIVILAAADPAMDAGDAANFDRSCGRLGSAGLKRAMTLAKARYRAIYGRKMPDF